MTLSSLPIYGATARPKLPASAVGLLHTGRATQVVTSGASGDIARVTKKGV